MTRFSEFLVSFNLSGRIECGLCGTECCILMNSVRQKWPKWVISIGLSGVPCSPTHRFAAIDCTASSLCSCFVFSVTVTYLSQLCRVAEELLQVTY